MRAKYFTTSEEVGVHIVLVLKMEKFLTLSGSGVSRMQEMKRIVMQVMQEVARNDYCL